MKFQYVFIIVFTFLLSACDDGGENQSCGNGIIDEGEECDGSDFGGLSCETLGYYGGKLLCGEDCRVNEAACEQYGRCGDGIIQSEAGEECDGFNRGGKSCGDFGYYDGYLGCSEDCLLVFSNCEQFGKCGDGEINYPYEDCEGESPPTGMSCESLGFYGGILRCGEDCRYDESECARCGDGIIQYEEGETCDGSNFGGISCESLGIESGKLRCDGLCETDYTECYYVYQFGTVGSDAMLSGVYDPETGDYFIDFISERIMRPGDIDYGKQEYVGRMRADGSIVWLYEIPGGVGSWMYQCENYFFQEPLLTSDGNVLFSLCSNFFLNETEKKRFYKFKKDGTEIWSDTPGGYVTEDASGYLYVMNASGTNYTYISKYTSDSSLLWSVVYDAVGEKHEMGYDITYCGGALYITLNEVGMDIGNDPRTLIMLKYDLNGNLEWRREIFYAECLYGVCADVEYNYISRIICTDENDLVITGVIGRPEYLPSYGEFITPEWLNSIFVGKYDSDGANIWFKAFNTSPVTRYNRSNALIEDSAGNIYIGGATHSTFPGYTTKSDEEDFFVLKFTSDGTLLWTRQWEDYVGGEDWLLNMVLDSNENIMVFGATDGRMSEEPYIGGVFDMFILHFYNTP